MLKRISINNKKERIPASPIAIFKQEVDLQQDCLLLNQNKFLNLNKKQHLFLLLRIVVKQTLKKSNWRINKKPSWRSRCRISLDRPEYNCWGSVSSRCSSARYKKKTKCFNLTAIVTTLTRITLSISSSNLLTSFLSIILLSVIDFFITK